MESRRGHEKVPPTIQSAPARQVAGQFGLAESTVRPLIHAFLNDKRRRNWFQEIGVPSKRGFAFAPTLVPRQSYSRIRSQNNIWRVGFHRRGYREAMRIQLADFRKSRAF